MKICAVVPTLDEGPRIARALAALQAAGVDECIVADCGSRDDTVARAQQSGARVVLAPRGRARQQNAGAAQADGEVLWFVHADTLVPTCAGAWIRRTLAVADNLGGAFCTRHVYDGPDPAPWPARLLPLADLRSRLGRPAYGDQAIFVRRAVFMKLGGFAAQPILEDVDLALRLRRLGRMPTLAPRVTVSGRRFVARPLTMTLLVHAIPALAAAGVPLTALARLWTVVR